MDHARTLARFVYRDQIFPLRIFVGQRPPAFVITCPFCGTRCRIGEAHRLVVDVTSGTFTVTPSLICPRSECGWRVEIRGGVASDAGPAPSSAATAVRSAHPERDRVCGCGTPFRSKSHHRCRPCREDERRPPAESSRFQLSRG